MVRKAQCYFGHMTDNHEYLRYIGYQHNLQATGETTSPRGAFMDTLDDLQCLRLFVFDLKRAAELIFVI